MLALSLLNGCMSHFKTWYGYWFEAGHGEAMIADDSVVASTFHKLDALSKACYPYDARNVNKNGSFSLKRLDEHCCRKTVHHGDTKKDKMRSALLAADNAIAKGMMPLMIIEKSNMPRPTGRKSSIKLEFDYHRSSKAWMDKDLSFASPRCSKN